MLRFLFLRGGVVLAVGAISLSSIVAADELQGFGASDVFTSYSFPDGIDDGVLSLDDQGVGVIASLVGGGQVNFESIKMTMSLPFVEELDDSNDDLAHGRFGVGAITLVDTSGGDPGVTVFEADVPAGFELAEDAGNVGLFAGFGTFTNAVYGGALSAVTLPLGGQIFTDLFPWYSDSGLTTQTNIDNFSDLQNVTVYGEMNINILPEPATLLLLATACAWPFGKRSR